jgi:hypothetical protein
LTKEKTIMGWAENRVQQFQRGKRASWLERRMLEHANPVHFPLALAASVGFAVGLWMHDWLAIVVASLLALSGHIYCWTRPGGSVPDQSQFPDNKASVLKAD